MLNIYKDWLVDQGLTTGFAAMATTATGILIMVFLAVIANFVAKRLVLRAVIGLAGRTQTRWDDVLIKHRVFHRFAHIAPALVIDFSAPAVFGADTAATSLVLTGCLLYMVAVFVGVADGVLNATVVLLKASQAGQRLPLTSFLQVAKLVLYGLAFIGALSVIIGKSPALLFSGLGAMTAVLMLVFKDPLLGLVAGIQLSANQMVTPGDWIEMPKYGADGDVLEVALTTVKVQNFDKTITTIPTYALISESFKNWRGMSESGGRRIKRALNIDMDSIRFCDDAILEQLAQIHYMADYLQEKRKELDAWTAGEEGESATSLHPRRLTNIGSFRAYVLAYLRNHPKIHPELTFLVRQLAPTEHGLPLEIYVFSSDQDWVAYEGIQADIFDHLLAVMSQFDLRIYQRIGNAGALVQERAAESAEG
jgi:miniconductance mechanosensitive channel